MGKSLQPNISKAKTAVLEVNSCLKRTLEDLAENTPERDLPTDLVVFRLAIHLAIQKAISENARIPEEIRQDLTRSLKVFKSTKHISQDDESTVCFPPLDSEVEIRYLVNTDWEADGSISVVINRRTY